MVLRTIIEIDYQHRDVGKAQAHPLPPALHTIGQAITGHFGGDSIYKQFAEPRQQDAHWCDQGLRLKIMVYGGSWDAALAAAGERADFDCRFGID